MHDADKGRLKGIGLLEHDVQQYTILALLLL